MRKRRTVRIVAIATGHQSLVHAMMFGLGEIRFDALMTAVTQCRLSGHQEIVSHLGSMNGMARGAAHVVCQVWRLHEVLMARALLMAA